MCMHKVALPTTTRSLESTFKYTDDNLLHLKSLIIIGLTSGGWVQQSYMCVQYVAEVAQSKW